MNSPDISVIISLVMSSGSLLGIFYLATVKIARMELKIDTVWDFLIRRALSETITMGIATKNSPVEMSETGMTMLGALSGPLRDFYGRFGSGMTDAELSLEIERRFGYQILHDVCIPNGLTMGACMIIAVQVAKNIRLINEISTPGV